MSLRKSQKTIMTNCLIFYSRKAGEVGMSDKEKVIKGLRCIIDGTVRCESCGYSIDKHGHHSCQQECAKDAISLLNEQDALLKEQDEEIREKNQRIWELLCERDSDDGR